VYSAKERLPRRRKLLKESPQQGQVRQCKHIDQGSLYVLTWGSVEYHFSESNFLNKTRKQSSEPRDRGTSSYSKSASESPLQSIRPNERSIKIRQPQKLGKSKDDSTVTDKEQKSSYESEIWDIELSSEPAPAVDPLKEGTVIVDTRALRWAEINTGPADKIDDDVSQKLTPDNQATHEELAGSDDIGFPVSTGNIKSSSSLGPSQSASQPGRRGVIPVNTGTGADAISKYFCRSAAGHLGQLDNPAVPPVMPTIINSQDQNISRDAMAVENFAADLLVAAKYSENPSPSTCNASRQELEKRPVRSFSDVVIASPLASSLNSLERALRDYEANNHDVKASFGSYGSLSRRVSITNSNELISRAHCCHDSGGDDYDLYTETRPGSHEDWAELEGDIRTPHLQSDYGGGIAFDGMDLAIDDLQLNDFTDEHVSSWELYENDEITENHEHEDFGYHAMNYDIALDDGQYEEMIFADRGNDKHGQIILQPDLDSDGEDQYPTRPMTWSTEQSLEDRSNSGSEGSMSHTEQFCQGRMLLRGSQRQGSRNVAKSTSVSRAEADVAKSLKGHWQPQRL
jgi:hypothetical protein